MSAIMNEKYLTTSEALEYLKIGRNKLFALIKSGKIKPRTLGEKKEGAKKGPSLRFTKEDLDKAFD